MRKKLENFWYYYKWYILGGILLLLPILNFLIEKAAQRVPDHQIALICTTPCSQAEEDSLCAAFAALLPDRDGDGQVTVGINYYFYDADTMSASDTALFMASAVQLSADLKNQISDYYLTNIPELVTEADPTLTNVSVPIPLAPPFNQFALLHRLGG